MDDMIVMKPKLLILFQTILFVLLSAASAADLSRLVVTTMALLYVCFTHALFLC
jgi:hypothetical protein